MSKLLSGSLRVAGWMLALLLVALAAVAAMRAIAIDDADRALVALAEQPPPALKGSNGFAALMLAGHDVAADRRAGVLAADVDAFARWQAAAHPDGGFWAMAAVGDDLPPSVYAPLADVPARAAPPAADELCPMSGAGCLEAVHRDPAGTRVLLDRHAARIAAAEDALSADHIATPYPATLDAPMPEFANLRLPLAAAALDAVVGNVEPAYARTCRLLAGARRMDRQATQVLDKMVAQALSRGAATLLLDLRRRHPVDTLPGECAAARAPVAVAEASVCEVMRGEYRLQRAFAARMSAQLRGWRPDRLLTRGLLVDARVQALSDARALAPYCTDTALAQAAAGFAPDVEADTLRHLECWSAYVSCVLARIGAPTYRPFADRALDHAAVLRLLLAAQRVADGVALPERAAVEAAVDGYPVAFDAGTQRATITLRGQFGDGAGTFTVEFAGLATMPEISPGAAIARSDATPVHGPMPMLAAR